jgi:hypothetical protein
MIKANNLTLIGEFSVDSGQAIIGDPCYLEDWKPWNSEEDNFEDHTNRVGEYGYLGACNATLGKGFGQLGGATAVAFSTGYGDGLYPVYADITEDGRVGMIVIDFTGEYNVEDN